MEMTGKPNPIIPYDALRTGDGGTYMTFLGGTLNNHELRRARRSPAVRGQSSWYEKAKVM